MTPKDIQYSLPDLNSPIPKVGVPIAFPESVDSLFSSRPPSARTNEETGLGESLANDQLLNYGRGTRTITVKAGDNIQRAVNRLVQEGQGGVILISSGNHIVDYDIELSSNIYLVGETRGASIIDFNGNAKSIKVIGSGAYSTGTVSVTNGSTTVTGSGTSWLSNVSIGQSILIKGIWYPVVFVASDTSLFIGLPFVENDVTGASYVVATTIDDTKIANLTVTGSISYNVQYQYCNRITIDSVNTTASAIGLSISDVAQVQVTNINAIANYSNIEITRAHYIAWFSSGSTAAQAGNGFTLDGVTNSQFSATFVPNSSGDGFNLTNCNSLNFTGVVAVESGGQGLELISNNENIVFSGSRFQDSASDGVKLTASSDQCFFTNCSFLGNGGYGLNIGASTCDNTNVSGNIFDNNTTADAVDSGTGTLFRGNVGDTTVSDNSVGAVPTGIVQYYAGETLAHGDAVYISNLYNALDTEGSADLELDNNDYLSCLDDTAISPTGSFTIEFWLKLESNYIESSGVQFHILSKWNAASNQKTFDITVDNSGGTKRLNCYVSSNGSTTSVGRVNHTPTVGSWVHYAIVYQSGGSGTVTFYIDGSSIGTNNSGITSIYDGTADFRVGSSYDNDSQNFRLDGKICDVRLWNTARGSSDISDNKFRRLSGSETGLVGYWPLAEDGTDYTSNGNDLSVSGSPVYTTDTPFTRRDVYKASASTTTTSDSFVGFISGTGTAMSLTNVIVSGQVTGLTGLTRGQKYYLSDTSGQISASAGTITRKVGIATSTTKLLITNIW